MQKQATSSEESTATPLNLTMLKGNVGTLNAEAYRVAMGTDKLESEAFVRKLTDIAQQLIQKQSHHMLSGMGNQTAYQMMLVKRIRELEIANFVITRRGKSQPLGALIQAYACYNEAVRLFPHLQPGYYEHVNLRRPNGKTE